LRASRLALTSFDRCRFDDALEYARASMMALANLLSHPALDNDPPKDTDRFDEAWHCCNVGRRMRR